jgi:glycosyltransferase involved in cell wall biosynthesis
MKILIVTHMLYPERIGGKEKYVVRLAEEWSKKHSVGLVFYSGRTDWRSLSAKGIRVHRVPWLPRVFPVSQIGLVAKALAASLISGYKIVYVNSLATPEIAGLCCGVFLRKVLVGAIHSPVELIEARAAFFSRWIKKIFLKQASLVVVVSKEIAAYLTEYTGISAGKVVYVPGGVEKDFFEIALNSKSRGKLESRSQNNPKIIMTSRRLVKEKGIDVLIKAVKILEDSGVRVKCFIAGEGPEADNLRGLTGSLGLDSIVTFVGRLSDSSLKKLISYADCCVISSYFEGTPLSLLEYMAAGKPVVATNVGGISQVLTSEELVVQAGNPETLANGIKKVLLDEVFAAKVGLANRECAKSYSWTSISTQLLDNFHHLGKID